MRTTCLVHQEIRNTGLGIWLTTHTVVPFLLSGATGMSPRTLVDVLPQFIEKVGVTLHLNTVFMSRKSLGDCREDGSSALLTGFSQSVVSDVYFVMANQGYVCYMILNS